MSEGAGARDEPSPAYFDPDRLAQHAYLSFGGRVTWSRLVLRVVVALLALVLVDLAVARVVPSTSAFHDAYRLPRELPTASLADYAAAIEDRSAESTQPVVLFLGASPTWGHRIENAEATYPYAFEAAAREAGWDANVYNVATNGQFVGDQYVIAKRLVDSADVVFVQLTYHTFNPVARDGATMRYRELPKLLGVTLDAPAAEDLGLKPSELPGRWSSAGAAVGERWMLWRERDAVSRALFGGRPQSLLAAAAGGDAGAAGQDDGFAAFDELDPGQQMIAISRYAENSAFSIDAEDSEVALLDRLARLMDASNKKAVFFVAPLNRRLIDDYELVDWQQYRENVAVLRDIVGKAGFELLDYNLDAEPLPAEDFADISHTTDEGGRVVGRRLYEDTWQYLGATRP